MNCPIYQAQLKYDIEHVDEIKNVVWRVKLKDKLGIPRNEKDKKDLEEHLENLKKVSESLGAYSIDKILSKTSYEMDKKFMNKIKSNKLYRSYK